MAKNGNEFKGNGFDSLKKVETELKEAIAERDAGKVVAEPLKVPLTPEEKATRSKVGRVTPKAQTSTPETPTSIEGAVGIVRNKETGEVVSTPTKVATAPEAPNQDISAINDYDALISSAVRKPLSTGQFSKNTPENVRAFEGTMLALIPKIGATAGFHATLEKSKTETNKLALLSRSFKEAKAKGADSFEFEFDGKKEMLTLEQANQRLSETKINLEAGRSDLQDRADTLLRDEKVFATAQQLREKTVENADKVLRQKLSSAKTEEEKLDIQNDSAILEGALNHLHTFKPNGGLETFGHGKRARFANTHSAITEIYKKYGIKPADESELKPKVTRASKAVAPAATTVATSTTAAATPKVKAKAKIIPSVPKAKKVSTAKPYEAKDGRKMRKEDLDVPEKEIGHRKMVKADLNYQDVSSGKREMIADDIDTPEKPIEHGPREMVERDFMPAKEYGEAGSDKIPNVPGTPWVKMTEDDLGIPKEAVGVGLEGDGVIGREGFSINEPVPVGAGLEGDGVVREKAGEGIPVGVGLEGDGVAQKEKISAPFVANPLESLGLAPEQIARIEAHKKALSGQADRINAEAEKKGFDGAMSKVSAWYNKQPMWKKVGTGALLTAVGVSGMISGGAIGGTIGVLGFGAARAYGTFGTWMMLNGLTSKMENRKKAWFLQGVGTATAFFLLPRLAQWVDMQTGIGQWIADKYGLIQTPPSQIPEAPTANPSVAPTPEAEAPQPPATSPSAPTVTIAKGDTIWGVVEKGLGQRPEFSGLDRAGKDLAIDTYMKKLGGMTPEQLKALGISSGDINKIQIGENIQLPVMQDQALFDKAVTDAKALTPEQKANILKYRAEMLSGPKLETAAYVPPAPEVTASLENNITSNYKNSLEYIFGNRQDRYKNFVSWKNPDYFINASNYTPDVIAQETRMQGVEIERLRDTLYQYKKAGLTGRTVEQLLLAGARSKAGL